MRSDWPLEALGVRGATVSRLVSTFSPRTTGTFILFSFILLLAFLYFLEINL